ncbi:GSCFA domain-containing protein [Nostoc sp. LEGE 12450]|uniref:GSCFA domain-containing protein n=1 Tax=Nostoc sp. LEGE 12450 TaxID=1828643 RepID=UPI001880E928|nr:GSCFA domain-containing protein [Nostoc sp. LEGE 12450]MBE8985966.1 GSCFA domain-containing protein [Nostoc sp. LEGE 12450]
MNILKLENDGSLVINEGSEVTNIGILHLILKSIFEASELEKEEEGIINFLLSNKEYLVSHDAVSDAVKKYLVYKAQEANNYNLTFQKYFTKILQHELKTTENRLAYFTGDKYNINSVFWPNPTHIKYPRSIYDELPYAWENKIIDKFTPVGSSGSCFAMEIAHGLQKRGYNYIITEQNKQSCAKWGIIFNTPSFRQLVEKVFGLRKTPKLLWATKRNERLIFCDPFREDIEFESIEDYENDYETHIERAREALLKVKVFVITLGMNEVWTLTSDGSVFSRCPWGFAASLVCKKVLTVEENISELQKMLDIWRIYNPDIKIILSVSPVPLHATFRGDTFHVIAANCHSKSILRIAAEEFASRNKNVFYLPAYETVLYCTKNPWTEDQRHVSREAVENVMQLFDKMFVAQEIEYNYPSDETLSNALKLREINLIIFPKWNLAEKLIVDNLKNIIETIINHPDKNRITLLIDTTNVDEEDVALLISGVTMNIFIEQDLDMSEIPEISLVGNLSEKQWDSLLLNLHARIVLEHENQDVITQTRAERIPIWQE